MRSETFTTLLLAPTVTANTAAAPPIDGSVPQFITAGNYSMLPDNDRAWYVAGILDADRIHQRRTAALFDACLKSDSLEQMTAIVDRRIATFPAGARDSMPVAIHNALVAECTRRGYKLPPLT
ncbi:hypothetical protein [Burkholderia sp. MBR-1]|uniref:hypothetical protein n=1 Tax=Burkholderia sp. MBR-1 TaxID=2732364 RepID=UPI0015EF2A24|nr:hypothetical protein [Burkholderia sp. MBR-1]QMI49887.1 hypothetical protein MBR110_30990 [Burkholderia sp. MBR-1]